MHRLIIVFGLLLSYGAQAATNLQDYAYQTLLGETDQTLQRVELPIDVLLALTRSDLSDLAVFNVNGKRLPHAVTRTPETHSEHMLVLPFHEFSRFQKQHSKVVTTREQNQQQGSISELQTTQTIAVQSERKDYLIELAPDEDTPGFDRIELQWQHEPASQILELRVEVGNELDKLRVIKRRKSLTNQESQDLGWRSINGIPNKQKYMRLTPINQIDRFELQQVSGYYRKNEAAARLTYQISPRFITEEKNEFYVLDLPSAVNAVAMRILPADSHSVIKGDVYATWNNVKQKQRIRYDFSQHNIDDADVKPSQPIKLPSRRDLKQIWFTSKTVLPETPRVELIYPQYEAVFIGDGNGPFTLAWGNYQSEVGTTDLSALLQGNLSEALQRGALVGFGSIEESGGASRLAPEPALPWQKWMLWVLLIAAALVTGRMALRLYAEMNQQTSSS
ncbi:MAG: DUF3999 domain-containing protein [Gammaproteobacteria bacterium]|nr:DUF3999 domain-containing protein [Gammaproteobacteria bacterium]